MIKILQEQTKKGPFKALLHCFSSSKELAYKALDLGIYISISGIVTFKNAHDLQSIVKELPLDRILVETDSPYLAPNPHRGKTNQPSFTKETADFIAHLKNISPEELYNITTKNFFTLFNKAKYTSKN
jgi:TatD DNase family protein